MQLQGTYHLSRATRPTARRCCVRPLATVAPASEVSTSSHTGSAVKLLVRSSWKQGFVHGSLAGQKWQDYPLEPVASSGGRWLRGSVPVVDTASSSTPLFEFVLTDGQGAWDKPAAGGNYVVEGPGTWIVRNNAISRATGKPVMVVSDLDGTMVGDDGATLEFKKWWEDQGVARGGVLVYNTGRALDSFQGLLRDKAHCLAVPDALISAVGTKVYLNDGGRWHEDEGWSCTLDADWALEGARDACYKALAQVGKEAMHFRPPEEQNPHKVTCGVRADVLTAVLAVVDGALEVAQVRANVITSGHGDWRYLDIVPIRAGKLQALHHVRSHYGFPVTNTVACGDSGNDILMLQGENPAIVVGNAQPDLRTWYEEQRGREGGTNSGPDGKARLFLAPKHEALSILEGLAYWGFK